MCITTGQAARAFWQFTLYDKDEMADLNARQRATLWDRVKAELQARRIGMDASHLRGEVNG